MEDIKLALTILRHTEHQKLNRKPNLALTGAIRAVGMLNDDSPEMG